MSYGKIFDRTLPYENNRYMNMYDIDRLETPKNVTRIWWQIDVMLPMTIHICNNPPYICSHQVNVLHLISYYYHR